MSEEFSRIRIEDAQVPEKKSVPAELLKKNNETMDDLINSLDDYAWKFGIHQIAVIMTWSIFGPDTKYEFGSRSLSVGISGWFWDGRFTIFHPVIDESGNSTGEIEIASTPSKVSAIRLCEIALDRLQSGHHPNGHNKAE